MCVNYKCQSFNQLNITKCPLVANEECGARGVSGVYKQELLDDSVILCEYFDLFQYPYYFYVDRFGKMVLSK